MDHAATVVITLGRMNPPTTGHLALIQSLFETAIQHEDPIVVVVLSSKTGRETPTKKEVETGKLPKDNPLPCNMKAEVVNKMVALLKAADARFTDVRFQVVCNANPFTAVGGVVTTCTPERVLITLGNEPEKVKLGSGLSEFLLRRRPDLQVGLNYVGRNGMSGTLVRKLVLDQNRNGFRGAYNGHLAPPNIDQLFTNIDARLNKTALETKGEKSKRLKAALANKELSPNKATAKRLAKGTAARKTAKVQNSKNAKALALLARRAP